jgi:hypothetical protein
MCNSVPRSRSASLGVGAAPALERTPTQPATLSGNDSRMRLDGASQDVLAARERRSSSASGERAPRVSTQLLGRTTRLDPAQDAANPNLQKSDLQPGDVWFWVKEDDPSHSTFANVVHSSILKGQQLEGLLDPRNTGDPNLCHAGLWVKNPGNPGQAAPMGQGEPEVVEASGGNGRVQGTALSAGLYKVYRPNNGNHGDWAAQTAMVWAEKREIAYSMAGAVAALFKSSSFGTSARQGAAEYAQAAFDERPEGIDEAFCSMLVAAAYQATAPHVGLPVASGMPVDANASSVRTLEYTIKSDPNAFTLLGHLRVNPGDVLFQELPPGPTPRKPRKPSGPIERTAFLPGAFPGAFGSGREHTFAAIDTLSVGARKLLQISAFAGDAMSDGLVGRLSPSLVPQLPALAAELEGAGLWSNGRPALEEIVECVKEDMAPELYEVLSGAADVLSMIGRLESLFDAQTVDR